MAFSTEDAESVEPALLATVDLSTERRKVREFARSLLCDAPGGDEENALEATAESDLGDIPATFAMTALADPQVLSRLLRLAGGEDAVLVHETQSFVYARPLRLDRVYEARVMLAREAVKPRLKLICDVTSPDEGLMIRLVAGLVLFDKRKLAKGAS